MRVLHVVECYEGGVGRAVDTLVAVTPEIEHHLLHAGGSTPGAAPPWSSTSRLPEGFRSRLRATREQIHALRPDVVHAHSSWAGVYTRLIAPEVPVVYQPHCYKFADDALPSWRRGFYRAAESMLARRTSVVAAVSESELRLARALRPGTRATLLPNAPVVELTDDDHDATTRQVATAGRISPQKGPDRFVAVARECRSAGVDANFVWIGDGDRGSREQLEDVGIRVTGWLAPTALQEELDHTSVYLHTARYEGFPLSVLDAAARHVPMVLRDIPAFEGSGLAVVPDRALATRVAMLLDDAAARRRSVAEGSAVVSTMNRTSLAARARAVYDDLVPSLRRVA